jgi:hypothetical protein
LEQTDIGVYIPIQRNAHMNCYHNCEPQNCLNYLICGESLPLKDLSDVGICKNCECTFGSFTSGKGILKINDEPQNACCSCLDKVSLVAQPHCEHYALCIKCFKSCYYNDESSKPKFPYDDENIQTVYLRCFPALLSKHEPIVNYHNECLDWHEENTRRLEMLAKCPLCRC